MAKRKNRRAVSQADALAEARARIANSSGGTVDLSGLGLEAIPEKIRELKGIRNLFLSQNPLKELPEWIGELRSLEFLALFDTRLRALPSSFARLPLTSLGIGTSRAFEIPDWLGEMKTIGTLSLQAHLKEVPHCLRRLTGLRFLDLAENALVTLPDWIGELRDLEALYVQENHLASLPPSLAFLPALQILNVKSNLELGLPTEITAGNDARKILGYYSLTVLSQAPQPLNEFKLVLVGRGLVGKTTLVHRLVSRKYKEFKRTPGIAITKWATSIEGDDVRAHVWDFGGQEIMHGTHRFFMTERALYVVLVSGREGTEDADAEYWLSLVRSFAGEDVPIIVLLHKSDDFPFELDRELLRRKYGRSIVFIETDSYTARGIDALQKEICRLAATLPGLKASWPGEWRTVKEKLPEQKRNWLTFDDFRTFCAENGVADERHQELLAESLHDLGLMLSYRKDESLRHFGVLNPQWVTKGIYEMLNAPALKAAGGKFTLASFADVLPAKTYPPRLHPFLLALMQKFRLCHPLDDKGSTYLIPELLSKEGPKLEGEFPATETLGFTYSYDVMLPEGLFPRFIVETYVHREPKLAWRTGVVLERANSRALVRADVHGRRIDIRVAGKGTGRRELLGIIREHFERIHRAYEHLPVTELVPVPGYESAPVKYSLLLTYERAGREVISVDVGGDLVDLRVRELLDGVDLPGVRGGASLLDSELRHNALRVFISYSHKDAVLLDQLKGALVPYERTGNLKVWSDRLIEPGETWDPAIMSNLAAADIVILLLSNDFLASVYCMERELAAAVERHEQGSTVIVPVVVRACRYDILPLGKIQAIQPGGKPVDDHEKPDPAWYEVTKQLDRVIARIRDRRAN